MNWSKLNLLCISNLFLMGRYGTQYHQFHPTFPQERAFPQPPQAYFGPRTSPPMGYPHVYNSPAPTQNQGIPPMKHHDIHSTPAQQQHFNQGQKSKWSAKLRGGGQGKPKHNQRFPSVPQNWSDIDSQDHTYHSSNLTTGKPNYCNLSVLELGARAA